MHRLLQIFIAYYLVLVLLTWPVLLAFCKYIDGGTWADAHRFCWRRWNEIRRNPYAL